MIGSGARDYREYILRNACRNGIPIALAKDGRQTWEKPWISASTSLRRLAKAPPGRFQGIATHLETMVGTTAELAARLRLPFYPPEFVARVQDKQAFRLFLAERGLPSIRSFRADSSGDCRRHLGETGFPAVVKPAKGYGSLAVFKLQEDRDVDFYYRRIAPSFPGRREFVLERYLDGPEMSAEVLVHRGRIAFLGLTDKLLSPEPFFEEIGHIFPAYKHRAGHAALIALLQETVARLEIAHGVFHAEARLTSEGPCLVEMNLRLAGDLIPLLVQLALGFDLATASLASALGREPAVTADLAGGACVRFILPEREGRVKALTGTEILRSPDVVASNVRRKVQGLKTGLSPFALRNRLGYFVVTAGSPAAAERRAGEILSALRIIYY